MAKDLHPEIPRAHSIVMSAGADTSQGLAWLLRQMADQIEMGRLSIGVWGGPSDGVTYSYRISPDQTHDEYFRQIAETLRADAA